MSAKLDQTVKHLGESVIISKVLKPLVEMAVFFVWLIYLVEVMRGQSYNGSLVFDLFLARVGGPTADHATTFLIFLSIFPLSYLMLRSVIPAFLMEALAFDIHEGLWQVAYYVAWHSVVDWRVWLLDNGLNTLTAVTIISAMAIIYRFPARFFIAAAGAWTGYLVAWLSIGFPVSVLSKLPGNQLEPSIYNTTLWVNQIEFLGWVYFAAVLLLSLRYLYKGSPLIHASKRAALGESLPHDADGCGSD